VDNEFAGQPGININRTICDFDVGEPRRWIGIRGWRSPGLWWYVNGMPIGCRIQGCWTRVHALVEGGQDGCSQDCVHGAVGDHQESTWISVGMHM